MATLSDVKAKQPEWFSRGNKKFFGDVSYKLLHGKITKHPFLVRLTSQWSDMFGQSKKYRYRINRINPKTLKIEKLFDEEFRDLDDVKEFLKSK